MHEFRWGLMGGLAVVVALVGGGLIVAAILAAAVLVPSLYLVYLYEAQVYRDEPAKTLGMTMAAGVVIGVVVSIVADAILNVSPVTVPNGAGFLVGSAVILPLIQEILKPLPVLGLRGSGKFAETIDGLTFGVAAGLGFAAAQTIVQFSRVIADEPVHTGAAHWLFQVLGVTVTTPLMQGTCTGILVAALWRPKRLGRPLYALALPVALLGHVAYSLVAQVLQNNAVDQGIVFFYEAVVVALLLVYVRHMIHDALLDEAKDFGFQVVACPHCRHVVGAAGFCPHCGGAVTAGPRGAVVTVAAVSSTPSASNEGPAAGGANA